MDETRREEKRSLKTADSLTQSETVHETTEEYPQIQTLQNVLNENSIAMQQFRSLPSASQTQIQQLLLPNEEFVFVEKPSRWRGNIIMIISGILGTFALILTLIFVGRVNSNVFIFLAVFPLALIASLYSMYRSDQRFFVMTDKRLISKPGWGDTLIIEYDKIVSSSIRYNWLMFLNELEIKHELPEEPVMSRNRKSPLSNPNQKRTKIDYVDSISNYRVYNKFLQNKIHGNDQINDDRLPDVDLEYGADEQLQSDDDL